MQNFFDQFDGPQQQPMQPKPPGIIRGNPKQPAPIAPVDMTGKTLDNQGQSLSNQLAELSIEERRAKIAADAEEKSKLDGATAATVEALRSTIDKIDKLTLDAKDNNGWFETGTSGKFARSLPISTAGSDLKSSLVGVKGKNAFAALQELAAQGVKLTPISNVEIDLAASSVANLDPDQTQQTFLDSLAEARKFHQQALDKLQPPEDVDAPSAGLQEEDVKAIGQLIQSSPNMSVDELRGFIRGTYGLDVQNADEILAHFGKTGQTPTAAVNEPGGGMIDQFYAGVGDVAQGIGDVAGIIGNPLNAGINALTGSELSTDLGQTLRDATGAPENASPVAAAINRGGASVLTGAGLATGLARGAGMGGNAVVSSLSQQPIQQGLAGASAGAASEGTRQAGGGPVLQGLAGLGAGVGGFSAANMAVKAARPMQASELAQTAQRQRVDLMPADAGGATVKRASSAAAQGPLSAAPIIDQAKKSTGQLQNAVGRNSRNAVSEDEAGELIRKGGDLFIKKTSERGSKLYDRAGQAAKGVTIKPGAAIDAIDSEIAKLSELKQTNGPLIKQLEKLKSDISSGVSVSGLRDARSQLGGATFDGKLRSGNEQRIYKNVLASLSDDIVAGLNQAGKSDAARMFKRADEFWKQRVEQIDEVLQPIMGKGKSGEDILKSVESMARGQRGGIQRLSRLMQELPPEQAQAVRETVVSRLGKATAGQQDDTGTAFSPSTFLTNWSKMSAKGKSVLFRDGELRKNLDDIARLASATKESQRFANSSNTAGGIAGNTMILGGVAYLNPVAAMFGAGSQYLTGKLLASPKFARWLAKVPANPAARKQHTKRLSAIASSEPIIANDIKSVMSFMNDGLSASPVRAVAQDEGDSGPKPPAQ